MSGVRQIVTTLLFCRLAVSAEIPAPVNLTLSAQNFEYVLGWKAGEGSPDGVRYTVTVIKLSSSRVVEQVCVEQTSLQCNLTQALSNPEETYYISVTAALDNHTSPQADYPTFKPIHSVTLDPPLLMLSVCEQTLCIHLQPPDDKLYSIYNSFRLHYNLTLYNHNQLQFQKVTEGLKVVTLTHLNPGLRYCANVSIISHNATFERAAVCATAPGAGIPADMLIIFACLMLMLMLSVFYIQSTLLPRLFSLRSSTDLPTVLKSFLVASQVRLLLLTTAESISSLFVESHVLQWSGEEAETEEKSLDQYEKLMIHVLSAQETKLLMLPSPPSPPQLRNISPLHSPSPDYSSREYQASPRSPPHHSSSASPPAEEEEEEESEEDVNLFSVTLAGVVTEDAQLSNDDPDAFGLPHSRSQSSLSVQDEDEDEDEDHCYLSQS